MDRLLRINVHAPYHASVEAARRMPEGGRIIVIGSVNGDRMPFAGLAAYALSKSGLQGIARGLARDFGPRGITVNLVQPEPIDTDANPADGPPKDLMHSFMAIKRRVRPEEVASMVARLAGPEAGFVTGAMRTIDGAFGALGHLAWPTSRLPRVKRTRPTRRPVRYRQPSRQPALGARSIFPA